MNDLCVGDAVVSGAGRGFDEQVLTRQNISQESEVGIAMARDGDIVGRARRRTHAHVCGAKGEGLAACAGEDVERRRRARCDQSSDGPGVRPGPRKCPPTPRERLFPCRCDQPLREPCLRRNPESVCDEEETETA